MKMKTRPYLLKIAIPNLVRFAIDDLRARNPYRLDEDLLGDVVSRGVKDMLDEAEAEKTDDTTVVAFPIPTEVDARLAEFLGEDAEDAVERERQMAKMFELGLKAVIDERLDLLKEPSEPVSEAAPRKVAARRQLGRAR